MVEWKKLSDVAVIKNGKDYKKLSNGTIPVYGTGGIMTYVDQFASDKPSVLLPRKGSVENIFYVDKPFWTVDTLYWTDIDTSRIDPKFLFMSLQRYNLKEYAYGGARPSLSQSILYNLDIPLPSLSEQQRIVEQLDTFTSSIENLKEQIAQRRKQYEYYRDQLLNLEGKEGVEMKKLGDICDNLDYMRKPITSFKRKAGIFPYYGASGIVDYVEGYIFDGDFLLVSEDGANLVARTYPIAFSINGKNWVNNHAHVLAFDNKITQKFVEIYLNMIDLSPWINGAAQPKLNQANLNIIDIPIPSLSEQQRIVSILDTFEASIRNLEQQLAQREKQYEYYRNKLLTFE